MWWEWQDGRNRGRKRRGGGSEGGRRGKEEAGIVGCREVLKKAQRGWRGEGRRGRGKGAQKEKGGD